MKNYLITGIAGTGKTTVANALKEKGYRVLETDDDFRISIEDMKRRDSDFIVPKRWANDGKGRHFIDSEKILPVLTKQGQGIQFLCGHGRNWIDYSKYFEKVFLLTVDEAELDARLKRRDVGSWGHESHEREDSLSMMSDFNNNIRQMNVIEINTDQPVKSVVEQIINNL